MLWTLAYLVLLTVIVCFCILLCPLSKFFLRLRDIQSTISLSENTHTLTAYMHSWCACVLACSINLIYIKVISRYWWGCFLDRHMSNKQDLVTPRSLCDVRCCLWIPCLLFLNLEMCLSEHLTEDAGRSVCVCGGGAFRKQIYLKCLDKFCCYHHSGYL